MQLKLLGGFEARSEVGELVVPPAAQRLAAFLALQGAAVHRAYVGGRLWCDATQPHANACLRSALWRLRSCSSGLVMCTSTHVSLAPHVVVDVREQTELARRLLGPAGAIDDLRALAVLEGDLLPDWYDDWVVLERERLRQLRLHALEAVAERLLALGRYGEALEAAFAAAIVDPLRESAQRLMIRTHLREGNVGEAVRRYRRFKELIDRELGLEPSPELTRLVPVTPP